MSRRGSSDIRTAGGLIGRERGSGSSRIPYIVGGVKLRKHFKVGIQTDQNKYRHVVRVINVSRF